MGFNEKVHAYIAAKYYIYLVEKFQERGRKAFIHGTQYYAEQRGRRMAQRAIRNGDELNFTNYYRYGEWVNTEEVKEEGCSNIVKYDTYEPEAILHITQCPWYTQFKEMELNCTAGDEYCKHLDNSIVRGYNPYLVYEVDQTLQTEAYCIHRIKNADFDATTNMEKSPENLKNFEYHCAHSYWSFNEVTSAIFGHEGDEVNNLVLQDFQRDYGKEMTDIIYSYRYTNFNVCN